MLNQVTFYTLLARFGGGHTYSSHVGSYSSGYSSGGGIGFFPIFFPVTLVSGIIGTIIFLIILFFIINSFRRGLWGNIGGYNYSTPVSSNLNFSKADTSSITDLDPNFSEQRFWEHVQALFFKFQQAWSNGNISTVQAFLTQSMYTKLKVQMDQLNSKNVQNVLEDISLDGMKIIKVAVDNNYEYLTIQLDASMKDYNIDKESKKVVEGDPYNIRPFIEFWEFIRSKSVQSDYSKGFVAQTCPNCGAPIDINEFGQCKYCNSAITSGNFDWVLDNIYQEGEFSL